MTPRSAPLTCDNCKRTGKLNAPIANVDQLLAFGALGSVARCLAYFTMGLPSPLRILQNFKYGFPSALWMLSMYFNKTLL